MVYKRATKKLVEAGLKHLTVVKGCYGPYLHDTRFKMQKSVVLKTPDDCVAAAIRGEVPAEVNST